MVLHPGATLVGTRTPRGGDVNRVVIAGYFFLLVLVVGVLIFFALQSG